MIRIKTVAEVLTLQMAAELHASGVSVVGEDGKVYLDKEVEN